MRRRLRYARAAAPAWVVLTSLFTSSCDDAIGPERPGDVSFQYAGARDGTFTVSGDAPRFSIEGVPLFEDWTLAAAGDSLGGVVIAGFRVLPTAGPIGRGDLFVLQLGAKRPGEFSCAPNAECHGRLLFGVPDTGGLGVLPAEDYFEIVSGRVDVTRLARGRIAGTFSFTARDEGGTGPRTLTVEDGSFDLELGAADAALSVLCMGTAAAGEACE